jgi:amylosucrase
MTPLASPDNAPYNPTQEALTARLQSAFGKHKTWPAFKARLQAHLPRLCFELAPLYGEHDDFDGIVERLLRTAFLAWEARPESLKQQDLVREAQPDWFQSEKMMGAVCYVDLFAGTFKGVEAQIPYFKELGLTYLHLMPPFLCPEPHSDGGYAVSSYRDQAQSLGKIGDLRQLATGSCARKASRWCSTSSSTTPRTNTTGRAARWPMATRATRTSSTSSRPRRSPMPTRRRCARSSPTSTPAPSRNCRRTLGVDDLPQLPVGSQLQQPRRVRGDGRRDAVHRQPRRRVPAHGRRRLHLEADGHPLREPAAGAQPAARLQRIGAHRRAVADVQVEAIVHPDDVVSYISPEECQISYNPLQMALLWNSLATREVNLLQQALEHRHNLPDHRLGELRAQPRRHRLDLRRRGRASTSASTASTTASSSTATSSIASTAASHAACPSRTTRRPATAASAARRPRCAGSNRVTRTPSRAWC